MTYEEAIKYIHGTHKFGIKLGLQNIEKLLDLLGNPHKNLNFIHVAGTNGKGSTVTVISSILIESGYKVGVFTSPYIERFTERICINREEISKDDLAGLTHRVKAKVSDLVESGYNHPTEFEITTAIALLYYYESGCDVVVLEVGLGGRYDSTNIIENNLVSVITSISFDHMAILGNKLEEIAYEKAGIIKKNGDIVLYSQAHEVEGVVEKVCSEMNATLTKVDFNKIISKKVGIDGQVFDYGTLRNLTTTLLGDHQLKNIATAITTCEIAKEKLDAIVKKGEITENSIREGINKARWMGRMELVSKKPIFFIDGAHNEDSARVMVDTLEKYFKGNRKIFIMGILKDKEYKKMVKIVAPIADKFFTVTPPNERALSSRELAEVIKVYCKNVTICDNIVEGIESAIEEAKSEKNDIICAFGSLYYIGEVRKYFLEKLT